MMAGRDIDEEVVFPPRPEVSVRSISSYEFVCGLVVRSWGDKGMVVAGEIEGDSIPPWRKASEGHGAAETARSRMTAEGVGGSPERRG